MNAYEAARKKACDAIVNAFLAALPPSIVIDGKVVQAHAVIDVMNQERKLGISMMEFLDAAREVAGRKAREVAE